MITKTKRILWLTVGSAVLFGGLFWSSSGNIWLAAIATVYALWWSTTVPPYFRTAHIGTKKDTVWAHKVNKGLALAIPVLGLVMAIPVYIILAIVTASTSGLAWSALTTAMLALPFSSAAAYLYISWEVHGIAEES